MRSFREFVKLDGMDMLKRHLYNFYIHLTPEKIQNLLQNQAEMQLRRPVLRSTPPFIKLEASRYCHLRCGHCEYNSPHSKKKTHKSDIISVSDVKRIIEPVHQKVVEVTLSLYGEPLNNSELSYIIMYLHSRNIAVSFPTNFSVRLEPDQVESLARSGLDKIMISLDGASEETYRKYRKKGDYRLVLRNVRLLSNAKKRLGLKRPKIVWKFVVFEHNMQDLAAVSRNYRQLGFDDYEFVRDRYSHEYRSKVVRDRTGMLEKKKLCFWPWTTMVIGYDGFVQPCTYQEPDRSFGNALEKGVMGVWNSRGHIKLRKGFSAKSYGTGMHKKCKECLRIS